MTKMPFNNRLCTTMHCKNAVIDFAKTYNHWQVIAHSWCKVVWGNWACDATCPSTTCIQQEPGAVARPP